MFLSFCCMILFRCLKLPILFMFLRGDNSKHRPLVPVDMPRKNSNVSIRGVILILIRNRLPCVFTAGESIVDVRLQCPGVHNWPGLLPSHLQWFKFIFLFVTLYIYMLRHMFLSSSTCKYFLLYLLVVWNVALQRIIRDSRVPLYGRHSRRMTFNFF